MEKTYWTDRVRNEEFLQRTSKRDEYPTKNKKRKANWIGHVLHTNYLIKHITEGNVEGRLEVTGRRGRRHRKLLDDFLEERGYCKLKSHYVEKSLWKRLWICRKQTT